MGGFFGVASKKDCVLELFYGVDYHSHLGTRRGGMAVYGAGGFNRAIHNIENSPFRTKFERDVEELKEIWESAVSQTMSPSRCCSSPIWEALRSQQSARSIIRRKSLTRRIKTAGHISSR